jgi:hypothetical protein
MVPASRAYLACRDLFNEYPLAASAVTHVPTMHTMVLMLRDGDDVRFFVLMRIRGKDMTHYTLSPWRAEGAVEIAVDGGEVSELTANAVEQGIPLPRDGLLFGWACEEMVTALIVIYTNYRPDSPLPAWSIMPLVGTPEERWPPFSRERFFGRWFWKDYQAGNIIQLGGLIAANPGIVFWVDTHKALGSSCCVVACDIKTSEGHILCRGEYLGAAALRAGAVVPSLTGLLAEAGKTDLAPRFQVPALGNG